MQINPLSPTFSSQLPSAQPGLPPGDEKESRAVGAQPPAADSEDTPGGLSVLDALPQVVFVVSAASAPATEADPAQGPEGPSESANQANPADRVGELDGEGASPRQLSEEEQRQVDELKKRDREVREHEQAHLAAAGQYARGGATFEYETGPDGHRYAVGGEVDIDASKIPDDPQGTIRKSQAIYRAAMAPADPSSQDRRVASQARQMQSEAQAELAEQRREETESGRPTGEGETPAAEGADGNSAGSEVGVGEGVLGQAGPGESAGAANVEGPHEAVSGADIDLPEAGGIDPGGFDGADVAGQVLDLFA